MSFLGLVGIPATPVTYPIYQGLKALSPALGAAFAGAEAAALLGLAAQGAAVVGAGALGWMIGTAIRENLLPGEPPLDLSTWVSGGTPGESVSVEFTFYSPPNAPISTNVILTAPFAGVLRKVKTTDDDVFYMRQTAPPLDVDMIQFNRAAQPDARVEITALKKLNGQPAENLKKVPVLPQKPIYTPVRAPVVIPATPQYPAIPITPTVVPTPGNDPDEDNALRVPGITVQIPELGLQIQYTPTDVRIGRYTSPETRAFDPPKIALPPGLQPPAKDPCPCPEPEGRDDEIICRIKTLQQELLDDGYITETTLQGPSFYHNITSLPDEFYRLEIAVTATPANVKKQNYVADDALVTWVGWLSWNFGGRKSDRIFLQFTEMGFSPPPGCTGFTVAMNLGCECSVLALTRKKKAYLDFC